LLERGVYISARNVAILETSAARAMHQTPRPNTAMEISSITGLQQNDQHDPQEDVEKDNATNVTKANRKIVHYDIIAFNAKKKHVYAIVACDDILKFQQCRAHALRGVKSSFLGRKNMLKKKSSKSKISSHLLAYTRTCLLCTHIYTHICRDLVHLDFESAGPPSVSSRMHSRDVSCTINVETVFKVNHAFRALSRIRTEHLSLRLGWDRASSGRDCALFVTTHRRMLPSCSKLYTVNTQAITVEYGGIICRKRKRCERKTENSNSSYSDPQSTVLNYFF